MLDNLIVCVLSDGFTAIERTMMEGGEPDRVLEMRRDFQRLMKGRYSEMIEELTGRKVLAFLSQAHVEPDLTIEMFLMDGPVAGFGALELVDSSAGRAERRLAAVGRSAPAARRNHGSGGRPLSDEAGDPGRASTELVRGARPSDEQHRAGGRAGRQRPPAPEVGPRLPHLNLKGAGLSATGAPAHLDGRSGGPRSERRRPDLGHRAAGSRTTG